MSLKQLFIQRRNSKRRQIISRKQSLRRNLRLNLRKISRKNTSLLITTRMQKLRKLLRLKHSHSLRQSHLQLSRRKLLRRILQTFLNNMFGAMNMEVKADITFDDEENSVNVDLSGDNMGVLIGKRGQTLDSIQYLTSLVINKNSEKYVRVKLDTENYRKRRKETLESLAKNIAYKVKRSRRPVSLEPMNPYERRIIHSALQADKFVSTRSEGEEPFRHVVVYLERENNNRYNR